LDNLGVPNPAKALAHRSNSAGVPVMDSLSVRIAQITNVVRIALASFRNVAN